MFAEPSKSTAVGANQLADVQWSAVFDDVELTAAEIRQLANEARPLIRSGGRWVDARPAPTSPPPPPRSPSAPTQTQLTGAEMLRLALGLEGSPLAGGISVEGGGWAADLLAAAADLSRPTPPPRRPTASSASSAATRPRRSPGSASSTPRGLGGCLALDMGLGKTPTMLAHLLATRRATARRS